MFVHSKNPRTSTGKKNVPSYASDLASPLTWVQANASCASPLNVTWSMNSTCSAMVARLSLISSNFSCTSFMISRWDLRERKGCWHELLGHWCSSQHFPVLINQVLTILRYLQQVLTILRYLQQKPSCEFGLHNNSSSHTTYMCGITSSTCWTLPCY